MGAPEEGGYPTFTAMVRDTGSPDLVTTTVTEQSTLVLGVFSLDRFDVSEQAPISEYFGEVPFGAGRIPVSRRSTLRPSLISVFTAIERGETTVLPPTRPSTENL